MAGFTPTEGEVLITTLISTGSSVDRTTNLKLILFTNTTISSSITAASLTRPTWPGYSDITLTDSNWSITGGVGTYPIQTFTATTTAANTFSGYAIITNGATPRILAIELDAAAPVSLSSSGSYYNITPTITFGSGTGTGITGFVPNEGKQLVAQIVLQGSSVDKTAFIPAYYSSLCSLNIVLYTGTVSASTTASTINTNILTVAGSGSPSATSGWCVDVNWTVSGNIATTYSFTFQPSYGDTWSFKGFAIITNGATPRILYIEPNPSGATYTFNWPAYNSYDVITITPKIKVV